MRYSHDLARLPNGQVMCCVCFKVCHRSDLHEDSDGLFWDVCVDCWDAEGMSDEG